MNKRWIWAVLILALFVVSACRPTAEVDEYNPDAESTVDEGICEPNDESCEDTTAAEATPEPTVAPTRAPQATAAPAIDLPADPLAERPGDWVMGAEEPIVTLLEYSDYLCPHCSSIAAPIMDLLEAFPDDIRFIYRHFPLSDDPASANHLAVRAAEAAGYQGEFFAYHNLLFERQAEWGSLETLDAMREQFIDYAAELGLDAEQFEADMDSDAASATAANSFMEAIAIGLSGTPSMFLNGLAFNPAAASAPHEQWAEFIEGQKALDALPVYEQPPMTIDPAKEYLATVETEQGTFVIQLWPDVAPVTVNNFVFLASEGWYDNVTFHRVIEDFMAQTGDPSGTGMGGPGYTFEDEIDPDLLFDREGLVAMANGGTNTNGSQWFVTFGPAEHLNGLHTIFGEVIEGMDVVNSLTFRDPDTGPDFDGDLILSVTIEEK